VTVEVARVQRPRPLAELRLRGEPGFADLAHGRPRRSDPLAPAQVVERRLRLLDAAVDVAPSLAAVGVAEGDDVAPPPPASSR